LRFRLVGLGKSVPRDFFFFFNSRVVTFSSVSLGSLLVHSAPASGRYRWLCPQLISYEKNNYSGVAPPSTDPSLFFFYFLMWSLQLAPTHRKKNGSRAQRVFAEKLESIQDFIYILN
jgi:hypothetical protein